MNNFNKKTNAFTLTEAIIVLVVLGIVAALTVPSVVRRQIEAANRTKIKKTMKVFDLLTNKIAVENDLKSTAALKTWATANDCENILKYFKPVKFVSKKDGTTTNCRFMTADKVAWDLTSYPDAVFALDEKELDNEDSPITFKAHAHFDEKGTLRVNDLAWEQANSKDEKLIADIEKMYNYPKKEVEKGKPSVVKDYMWKTYPTSCYKLGSDESKWKSCTIPHISDARIFDNSLPQGSYLLSYYVLDEKGHVIEQGFGCNLERKCNEVWLAINDGNGGYIPIISDATKRHSGEEFLQDYYDFLDANPDLSETSFEEITDEKDKVTAISSDELCKSVRCEKVFNTPYESSIDW